MNITRNDIADFMKTLQDEICTGLDAEDGGKKFQEDAWTHETGGGGRSRVIQHGNVFEKGGVNFSAVEGEMPEFMKERVNPDAKTFFATGVSLVIHPENPMVLALTEIPEGPVKEAVVKEFQFIPLATKLAVPPVEEYDPVA